ncbi:hypothetical protein CJF31_00008117 [Rutstroemia sp. NJR-2017a BVV2]|nr:hypothetical protein CJF31_00008117 [Rutstroemia sp. NJR-2017a BVV2]
MSSIIDDGTSQYGQPTSAFDDTKLSFHAQTQLTTLTSDPPSSTSSPNSSTKSTYLATPGQTAASGTISLDLALPHMSFRVSTRRHTPLSPPKKKRRRKPPRGCRAEFDYSGWETYNLWRRETSLLNSQHHKQPPRTPYLKTAKDCYRDCDFPSECQTIPATSPESILSPKRKSDPELMFPLSPSEILRLEAEAASEKENEQLLFDIAATTPPCIGSTHHAHGTGTGVGVPQTGRERRRSLEAEKRGVEDEALFVISPITALVDPDVAITLNGWDFNTSLVEGREPNFKLAASRSEGNLMQLKGSGKGKQREVEISLPSSSSGKSSLPAREETEEDEELIVREFIRVKKKKSIAKIEQLTGLKMSEVQYGKMVGEEVAMEFDTLAVGGGGTAGGSGRGGRRGGRRGGVELDSPPSSPLKMFYTVEDSDTESGSEGEDEGGYGGYEEEGDDKLTWDEVRYGVR